MKEVDELAAALRQAEAAAEPKPQSAKRTVAVYHQGLTHHARTALERIGIDDERAATAITLAKAEERATKIAAGGFDVPWSLKREIAHLNEQLERNTHG
jgi:hypothetical protein